MIESNFISFLFLIDLFVNINLLFSHWCIFLLFYRLGTPKILSEMV